MKKIKFLLLGVIILFPLWTISANAIDMRSGDNLYISEDVLTDLYLFSGNVVINADIYGDLYVLGGSVSVNGKISDDLVIAGGKVSVMGTVGDDLRIVGGQVDVYSEISGDLIMLGGQLSVGPRSLIMGSVFAGGGFVSIDGEINGNLTGTISSLMLNGLIGGDVNITIENVISFSDEALVLGDFVYRKLIEAYIPEDKIKGEIEYREFSRNIDKKDNGFTALYFGFKLFSFLNAVLLILLLVLFSPKFIEKSSEVSKKNLLKTFSVGLLTVILLLIGSIMLLMTILGIQLALIAGFVFGALIYLSKLFTASIIASYLVDFKKKKFLRIKLFFAMTLAMLVYYLVGMTPYIGWFLNVILFVIGIGSIILTKQYYLLYLKNKNQI